MKAEIKPSREMRRTLEACPPHPLLPGEMRYLWVLAPGHAPRVGRVPGGRRAGEGRSGQETRRGHPPSPLGRPVSFAWDSALWLAHRPGAPCCPPSAAHLWARRAGGRPPGGSRARSGSGARPPPPSNSARSRRSPPSSWRSEPLRGTGRRAPRERGALRARPRPRPRGAPRPAARRPSP